jgi:hypothetical protein
MGSELFNAGGEAGDPSDFRLIFSSLLAKIKTVGKRG